ncbi:unnamed protein product [Owenia fusiformis]|uniref:Uncharacterized protein n=1 Tax=Owenia fusiformis TaxID=6347 RepID=A0A8J1XGQ6_OWEFU|nr:unnamed protein product [Owenia fusiformis]
MQHGGRKEKMKRRKISKSDQCITNFFKTKTLEQENQPSASAVVDASTRQSHRSQTKPLGYYKALDSGRKISNKRRHSESDEENEKFITPSGTPSTVKKPRNSIDTPSVYLTPPSEFIQTKKVSTKSSVTLLDANFNLEECELPELDNSISVDQIADEFQPDCEIHKQKDNTIISAQHSPRESLDLLPSTNTSEQLPLKAFSTEEERNKLDSKYSISSSDFTTFNCQVNLCGDIKSNCRPKSRSNRWHRYKSDDSNDFMKHTDPEMSRYKPRRRISNPEVKPVTFKDQQDLYTNLFPGQTPLGHIKLLPHSPEDGDQTKTKRFDQHRKSSVEGRSDAHTPEKKPHQSPNQQPTAGGSGDGEATTNERKGLLSTPKVKSNIDRIAGNVKKSPFFDRYKKRSIEGPEGTDVIQTENEQSRGHVDEEVKAEEGATERKLQQSPNQRSTAGLSADDDATTNERKGLLSTPKVKSNIDRIAGNVKKSPFFDRYKKRSIEGPEGTDVIQTENEQSIDHDDEKPSVSSDSSEEVNAEEVIVGKVSNEPVKYEEEDLPLIDSPVKRIQKPTGSLGSQMNSVDVDIEFSDVELSDSDNSDDDLQETPSALKAGDPTTSSIQAMIGACLEPSDNEDESLSEEDSYLPVPVASNDLDAKVFDDLIKRTMKLKTIIKQREGFSTTNGETGGNASMRAGDEAEVEEKEDSQLSLNDTGENLGHDSREKLKKFQVENRKIMERHPGEEVFSREVRDALPTEELTLHGCGFKAGNSYIDKHLMNLATANAEMMLELLTCDMIQLLWNKVSHPHQLLNYIFRIVSSCTNSMVTHAAFKIIYDTMTTLSHNNTASYTWVPSIGEVVNSLCAMGASVEQICPVEELVTSQLADITLKRYIVPHCPVNNDQVYNRENLVFIIKTITLAVQKRPDCYSCANLSSLFVIVVNAALDLRLNNSAIKYDVQVCLAAILNAFSIADWNKQRLFLCDTLPTLSMHHHNRVYICNLLPPGERGTYLRRHTALRVLYEISGCDKDSHREDIELSILQPIICKMKQSLDDLYKLTSVLNLLDLVVGSEKLNATQRESLNKVSRDMMTMLHNKIKDDIRQMDNTRVKDHMARLHSKWNLQARNQSEQTVLTRFFSQAKSSMLHMEQTDSSGVQIEHVKASQSDHDSELENVGDSMEQSLPGDIQPEEGSMEQSLPGDIQPNSESQKMEESLPEVIQPEGKSQKMDQNSDNADQRSENLDNYPENVNEQANNMDNQSNNMDHGNNFELTDSSVGPSSVSRSNSSEYENIFECA